MSTAQVDKADYPQCGELGPWFVVCSTCFFSCVNVHTHTHTLTVYSLLTFAVSAGVCAHVTELSYSNPSNRDEGLSGFSKWDFKQRC